MTDRTLDPARLDAALSLLAGAVADGSVGAAAATVTLRGEVAASAAYGESGWPAGGAPIDRDAVFLVASLTKPVVSCGIMLLLQEGRLALDDAVVSFLPAFGAGGKEAIRIRHLLTHTSGLPDQLENNMALRARHAPLSDFVVEVCRLAPRFTPGTRVSYQSMGILMLQWVAEAIAGQPLPVLLRERLFAPLGMASTTLGRPSGGIERTVRANPSSIEPHSYDTSDWGWNSAYWRGLGAPWGGLHSTAGDLGCLLSHMLGYCEGPLAPAARAAMTRDQLASFPAIPPEDLVERRWGLGWALGARWFGDLVSPRTFGHIGATGTLYWADPDTGLATVLLTNQPAASRSLFARWSNAVAAALD